jgi:glutamate synthase (NADPH) large chain
VNLDGRKTHEIVQKGIQILINLTHRGACGCDPETGDGAGVLIQIPHEFFARECLKLGFTLPEPGSYGIGMMFLPVENAQRLLCEGIVERIAREEGLTVLGWRDTPLHGDAIGRQARATQPYIEQIFLQKGEGPDGQPMSQDDFERKLYVVRRRADIEIAASEFDDNGFFYGCYWPRRFPTSTRSWPIGSRRARFAWCISGFRPTRFRPGNLRIPIA